MRTVKKVVITTKEWETLNNAADLIDTWFTQAATEDYKAIEEMFETIGEKYDGYSYIDIIRNTLIEVCDEIGIE